MIRSWAFLLTLLANVLFWLSFQSLFPVLPLYVASLGGTPADNGLTMLAAAAMAVLSRMFIGTLADQVGRRPVMVMGGVISIIAPILYTVAHTIPVVLMSSALRGIGIAAFTTGFQALLADLAPPERRGEAFGWGGNSGAFASLIGPLTGDWLASRLGFPVAFGAAALCGGLCTLAAFAIREPRGEPHRVTGRAPWQGVRETLALRNVLAGIAAVSPMGMVYGAMVSFWPLVAKQHHLSTTGTFYSVYALGQLTMQILAGRLSDRLGRTRVMLPGMLFTGIAIVLIPQVASDVASLWVAFGCGAGLGIARTAIDALVLDGVPITLRGTAVAVEFTVNDLWIGLGSAVLGTLATAAGFGVTYAVAGATCVMVVGALFAFGQRPAVA